MRFWKKRLQRVAAMVCSVALAASMMPTAAFATEPEPTPTPEPTPGRRNGPDAGTERKPGKHRCGCDHACARHGHGQHLCAQ